jgi:phosphoribosyl 1,2-cyclic phosphodiesterase
MKIRFWGVRGSVPTPGNATAMVGGNTTCVEVRAGGKLLIFDMGTGARALGGSLLKSLPVQADVFLSHLHHDHTQGLPFFAPCFIPGNSLSFHGPDKGGESLKTHLERCFGYPYFPVPLKVMKAAFAYSAIEDGAKVELAPGLSVECRAVNHPDGAFGYRVEALEEGRTKVFTFCTDTEHYATPDWKVLDLARQADVFVYDAQYTAEEYPTRIGWGHSTPEEAIKLAREAQAKRLVLFHHDPSHDDAFIAAMEAKAQAEFSACQSAREGLELEI